MLLIFKEIFFFKLENKLIYLDSSYFSKKSKIKCESIFGSILLSWKIFEKYLQKIKNKEGIASYKKNIFTLRNDLF